VDFVTVKGAFGSATGPAPEPAPEPATLGLLALGGLGVFLRRRR